MAKEEIKEYMRAYYQAHKEEKKAYYQANKDKIKKHSKEYYESHKNEMKEHSKKWYQEHKDEQNSRCKEWNKEHKEEIKTYQKYYHKSYNRKDSGNTYGRLKEYLQIDDNKKKHCTRQKSNQYLFKTLKHHKVSDYEIHHCFGYDDFKHFIYIPKELHQEIHQFLRDNGISTDSNHFIQIEHIIINYLEHNNKHILILK